MKPVVTGTTMRCGAVVGLLVMMLAMVATPTEALNPAQLVRQHLDPFGGLGNLFDDDIFSVFGPGSSRNSLLWDPFQQDAGKGSQRGAAALWRQPRVDVEETDEEFLIVMEVPGLTKEDVSVEVVGKTLSIRGGKQKQQQEGEKKEQEKVAPQEDRGSSTTDQPQTGGNGKKVLLQEGGSGFAGTKSRIQFCRSFQLPDNADMDKVVASQQDGLLRVTVHKKAKEEPKRRLVQIA